jgi:hypothetical protein
MVTDIAPQAQLDGFLAKYLPEVAAQAVEALERVRACVPGATELVYDNYNALVIGFGPGERASEAVLSIAVLPRWVDLCFLQSASTLPDPLGLLRGNGKLARHIVLAEPADIDTPAIRALIGHALAAAPVPIDAASPRRMIIKSISAKQRPRRPKA